MKDTQQVETTELLSNEDDRYMTWFDTVVDALFKVIILIFCSFMAGVGFAFGSRWAWILYDLYVEWVKTQ